MRVENEVIAHWLGDRMVEDGIVPSRATVPHLWIDARAKWEVSFVSRGKTAERPNCQRCGLVRSNDVTTERTERQVKM